MATAWRLPWEVVETLPSTDEALLRAWDERLSTARTAAAQVRALVGTALVRYWAVQEDVLDVDPTELAADRRRRIDEATTLARRDGDPVLVATALLGRLYACWGPDDLAGRDGIIDELCVLAPDITDEELSFRIREWVVTRHFDRGDLAAARADIEAFRRISAETDLVLFRRREELWRGNLAMLEGRLDEWVRINEEAISTTPDTAGSPFSFQNVAVTLAIERYLRRGLGDVIEAIRSIRASSPRVGANWATGLAFALAETGQTGEAGRLFDALAADDFSAIPRDVNWLVTMQLLGLVAIHLDDHAAMARIHELVLPFRTLDATHGSGYASYGPVARVLGTLAARTGDHTAAAEHFEFVFRTRDPGPWTSLARLDAAVSLETVAPTRAVALAADAEAELRALDMDAWATLARTVRIDLLLQGHGTPIAVRREGRWHLRHGSGHAVLRDSVGIRQLTALLARPGETIETADLDTTIDRRLPIRAADHEPIDAVALAAYRRRLAELDGTGDRRGSEAEFLRRALAGSRFVPSGSAELERIRVRVTKALKRTIDAISESDAGLGAHLAATVETGRRCVYAPADGDAWQVERLDAS